MFVIAYVSFLHFIATYSSTSCGFGFTKTHTDLFKGLTYPFFRNEVVQIGDYQENVSEDATFCLYVERYLGIRPRVIADLKIGHLKEQVI